MRMWNAWSRCFQRLESLLLDQMLDSGQFETLVATFLRSGESMAPKFSKAVSAPRCQYKTLGSAAVKSPKLLRTQLKKPTGWDKVGEVGSEKLTDLMAKVDGLKKKAIEEESIMLSFSPMVTYKYIGQCWVQVSGRKALLWQRAWIAFVAVMICVIAGEFILITFSWLKKVINFYWSFQIVAAKLVAHQTTNPSFLCWKPCFPGKNNEDYHILCQPLEPIMITLMVEGNPKKSNIYNAWLLQDDEKVSAVKQFQILGGMIYRVNILWF